MSAQPVKIIGSVTDSITGTGLYHANIVLREAINHTYLKGTITNESGYFQLIGNFPISCLLTISYVGYHIKELQINLGNKKQVDLGNISLSVARIEIPEVEVIFKPLIQYGDDSDVTLNLDMLGDLEGQSIFDVISSLTGLHTDFDEKIRYNGYTDFTVLIDGKKLGATYLRMSATGNMEVYKLKQIPAKYIKTVEILPEPKGRYGYYTPVINLIPKGNLRDFYTVFTEAGIEDKYSAGIGISRIYKKLTITPEISYKHLSAFSDEDEDRKYSTVHENSFTRNSETSNRETDRIAALRAEYQLDETENLKFSAVGNFAESVINMARNTFYSEGKNDLSNDYRYSRSPQYQYTANYRKRFYIGPERYLYFNINASMNKNSGEGKQIITDQGKSDIPQNYRSDNEYESKDLDVKFNYSNIRHRFTYFFNAGILWNESDENAGRELFDWGSDTWKELTAFSSDRSFSRFSSDLSFKISRRYEVKRNEKTIQHYFSANISENLNTEKIFDYLKDHSNKEKNAKTSLGVNYRGILSTYGSFVFDYKGQLRRPTAKQLLETPVYIDDYTIRLGNSGLKSEMVNTLTIDYFWNSHGVIRISKAPVTPPPFGYSVSAMYSASSNRIVQSHSIEDGILIYSYKNSNGTKMLTVNSNFYTRVSTFMNIKLGVSYKYDTYDDNAGSFRSGNSWSTSGNIDIRLFKKLKLEGKYQYNSPRIIYQGKNYGYHEGSVSMSVLIWKDNIDLSLEATNLLARSGQKSVYYGENYNYKKITYPEYPIIWIRASLMLFKFQKKQL
jgi:hypothetical protein